MKIACAEALARLAAFLFRIASASTPPDWPRRSAPSARLRRQGPGHLQPCLVGAAFVSRSRRAARLRLLSPRHPFPVCGSRRQNRRGARQTAPRHTAQEFISFLHGLVERAGSGKEIHVVLDNLSAHKTKDVDRFLAEHPRVRFHFTPTYSSWLNQVELWFAKIQRDVIARGVFTSVADLGNKLREYLRAYSKSAQPFRWTYTDPSRRIRPNKIAGTAY